MGKELQFDGWQVPQRLVIRALFGAFPPDVGPGPSVQVLVRSFLASCGLSRSAPKPEVWGSHRQRKLLSASRRPIGCLQELGCGVFFGGAECVYKKICLQICRHKKV